MMLLLIPCLITYTKNLRSLSALYIVSYAMVNLRPIYTNIFSLTYALLFCFLYLFTINPYLVMRSLTDTKY